MPKDFWSLGSGNAARLGFFGVGVPKGCLRMEFQDMCHKRLFAHGFSRHGSQHVVCAWTFKAWVPNVHTVENVVCRFNFKAWVPTCSLRMEVSCVLQKVRYLYRNAGFVLGFSRFLVSADKKSVVSQDIFPHSPHKAGREAAARV